MSLSPPPPYSGAAQNTQPAQDPQEPATGKSSGIQLARDADLLIRTYIPPPPSTSEPQHDAPALPLPLCIPQFSVNPKHESAFVRGYNASLEHIGITQEILLNFIDGLNMAINASPPLRVVDLAGRVIGFVPYHWAMIAGIALQTSAQIGIRVLSKTLTDRYLRAANLNLFKPRGLSVRLCTTPAMKKLLDSTTSAPAMKKVNKFGRGVGSALLGLPIPVVGAVASTIIHAVADKPPTISPTGISGDPIKNPVLMRRLGIVEGQALPLDLGWGEGRSMFPPPAKPQGVMDSMAAWGVKFDGMRERQKEKSVEERRRALQRINDSAGGIEFRDRRRLGSGTMNPTPPARPQPGSNSSSFKGVASQAYKAFNNRQFQREEDEQRRAMALRQRSGLLDAIGIGGRGGLLGAKKTRMEQKVADADLLEYWAQDKVLWVVIMPAEKDDEIQDIGIAEAPENEEHIEDATWRAEMEIEREEIEMEDLYERELEQQHGHA